MYHAPQNIMDTNDPPPGELPADPEAALRLLNTVNVPKLKQWFPHLGLKLPKRVKRAGVLKVLSRSSMYDNHYVTF